MERKCKNCQYYDRGKCTFYIWYPQKGKGVIDKKESDSCIYYKANKNLCDSKEILKINGSTEPAIMAGMTIRMIPGDEKNFKITTKADLQRFEDMVRIKK